MINYRKYYWIIAVGVFVIAIYASWQLNIYSNHGELIALIDVTLTTIALLIAIFEILMVRNIAESSQLAVAGALIRIGEIMSVSDISKGVKTAYDIQKYLRSNDFLIAHIRMQDLKFIVIPLTVDKRFMHLQASQRLAGILTNLSVDINNIDSYISGKKNKLIDIVKINENLEALVTILIEYENYIKSS